MLGLLYVECALLNLPSAKTLWALTSPDLDASHNMLASSSSSCKILGKLKQKWSASSE